MQVLQPQSARTLVWALLRSLAATSRISKMISFPGGTEMFHFPPFAPMTLVSHVMVTSYYASRVAPFRNLRIKVY